MNVESGMTNFADLHIENVVHMSVIELLQLPPREGPAIEQPYPQGVIEVICDIYDFVHSGPPFLMEGGPLGGPPLTLAAKGASVPAVFPGTGNSRNLCQR